jgi:alpha-L-fucosidase
MTNVFPTKAQSEWMKLGYGMFIHFGPNSVQGVGWGDGTFPAANFNPSKLDARQWAQAASDAGMKYAVLTAKHHDGFCLWQSKYTEYCVKNSAFKEDVVKLYVDAFKEAGLKTGLYYSLWDRNFPDYNDDEKYTQYMKNQLTELLTEYGDIVELWFDGGWDKEHPTKDWPFDPKWENDPKSGFNRGERWSWKDIYELIHKLQPDCIVINNSSSDRPGKVRYHPVDARTSEHYNFIWQGKVINAQINPVFEKDDDTKVYIPLEYSTSLNPYWFYTPDEAYSHPSAETICGWYNTARKSNANLLLNVGPNADGLISQYHIDFLSSAVKLMQIV